MDCNGETVYSSIEFIQQCQEAVEYCGGSLGDVQEVACMLVDSYMYRDC